MRGQAFIVFEEIDSAKKAVTSMQGFPFHDKKMRIAFARVNNFFFEFLTKLDKNADKFWPEKNLKILTENPKFLHKSPKFCRKKSKSLTKKNPKILTKVQNFVEKSLKF